MHSVLGEMAEEREGRPPNETITRLTHKLLVELGEDPERDGLMKTPERVARAWEDLTAGYSTSPEELLNGALFDVAYDEMVIVKDIEVFSLCEHHLLPFFGKAHVAYIPDKKVIGLPGTAGPLAGKPAALPATLPAIRPVCLPDGQTASRLARLPGTEDRDDWILAHESVELFF